VQIFKSKWLGRFARREKILDANLREAIERAEQGSIDADLGGGLIKQRVAKPGDGRSGGYRMIVAYRVGNRAVFLYGFAKNERENIEPDELRDLHAAGARWLQMSADTLAVELAEGRIQEIKHANDNQKA